MELCTNSNNSRYFCLFATGLYGGRMYLIIKNLEYYVCQSPPLCILFQCMFIITNVRSLTLSVSPLSCAFFYIVHQSPPLCVLLHSPLVHTLVHSFTLSFSPHPCAFLFNSSPNRKQNCVYKTILPVISVSCQLTFIEVGHIQLFD